MYGNTVRSLNRLKRRIVPVMDESRDGILASCQSRKKPGRVGQRPGKKLDRMSPYW
jgi:hypothetical protein